MLLKPTFLNIDFRLHQLALASVPFIIWSLAISVAALFWRQHWGILAAVAIFYLGCMLPKLILSVQYSLASQALPVPLKGLPGKDFLLFDFEPPETAHKLKIFPEDVGFIYSEAGRYRITTLRHDFSVPFAALQCETQTNGSFGKVFFLRFQPAGSAEIMKLAATVKYIGDDLKVAADETLKYEWASKIIESMKA